MSSPTALASCTKARRSVVSSSAASEPTSETHSDKLIADHVPNSPALVGEGRPERWQQVLSNLLGAHLLGDGDQSRNGEKPDRVLVVRGELSVQRNDVRKEQSVGAGEAFGVGLGQRGGGRVRIEGVSVRRAGKDSRRGSSPPLVVPWAYRRFPVQQRVSSSLPCQRRSR